MKTITQDELRDAAASGGKLPKDVGYGYQAGVWGNALGTAIKAKQAKARGWKFALVTLMDRLGVQELKMEPGSYDAKRELISRKKGSVYSSFKNGTIYWNAGKIIAFRSSTELSDFTQTSATATSWTSSKPRPPKVVESVESAEFHVMRTLRILAGMERRPSPLNESVSSKSLVPSIFAAMTGMQESRYVVAKATRDMDMLAGVFREICIKMQMSIEDSSRVAEELSKDFMPSRERRFAPKDEPGTVGSGAPSKIDGSPNREMRFAPKESPRSIGAVPMDDVTGEKKVEPNVTAKDSDPFIQKPWARRGRRARH